MQLVYSGPHPEATIEDMETGYTADVKAGTPLEVPDDIAARLLEQSTWAQVTVSKPTTPPATVSGTTTTKDNS